MKICLLAGLWLLAGTASQPRPFALSDYRWKHRLLLVFAPDADKTGRQIALLRADSAGLQQRDLLVIHVFGQSGAVNEARKLTAADVRMLRKQFRIGAGDFGVVLVGKDGGEKRRWHDVVPVKRIYAVIDAMPMRQAETKQRQGGGLP